MEGVREDNDAIASAGKVPSVPNDRTKDCIRSAVNAPWPRVKSLHNDAIPQIHTDTHTHMMLHDPQVAAYLATRARLFASMSVVNAHAGGV